MTTLHLTLVTEGPVLSAGLGADLVGLDATMRRDGANRPLLPGSHIRGRVREALGELLATLHQTDDPVVVEGRLARLFGGAPGVEGGAPSSLLFGDFIAATGDGESRRHDSEHPHVLTADALTLGRLRTRTRAGTRTRVAIDRHTGTARKAHLGFVEAGSQGARRTWHGTVTVPDGGAAGLSAEEVGRLVVWGLRLAGSVGRNTMSGWGRIADVRTRTHGPQPSLTPDDLVRLLAALDEATPPAAVVIPAASDTDGSDPSLLPVDIAIVLHSPLLVADGGPFANVFEGRTDIPGSVIRRGLADALLHTAGRPRGGWVDASLAEQLPAELRPLADGFGQIRSSFGFAPVAEHPGQLDAPVHAPWPASVVVDDGRHPTCLLRVLSRGDADLRLFKQWVVDRGPLVHRRQDHVRRTLLANVAKDRRTGAGAEGQLFVNRAIADAWQVGDQLERARFYARLWVPTAAVGAVRALLPRVEALGKSIGRGLGRVRLYLLPDDASALPTEQSGWEERLTQWNEGHAGPTEVPVTLVTETLLLDAAGWLGDPPLQVGADLTAAYTQAWRDATGLEDLQLGWFSASHRLRGGATARGRAALPPLVTTRPGSCFVLRLPGMTVEQAIEALQPFSETGVEHPALLAQAEDRWRRIVPYRSANGYGQLLFVHPSHTAQGAAQ